MKRLTPLLRFRRIAAAAALAAAAFWSGCSDLPNSLSGPDPETAQASLTRIQELDIRPALEAQARHGDQLMAISGVVGHAVGLGANGEPTVVVFTLQPGTRGIPDRVDGIPTRTVVSGMFVAGIADEMVEDRPVPLGVSIGHPDITAGTLGFKVKDLTDSYILSNNHVMANSNKAEIGDNILQPGPADGGSDPADKIGILHEFENINFNGPQNVIDAAIAKIDPNIDPNDVLPVTPDGYAQPSAVPRPATSALINEEVTKYGRTTGRTGGTVVSISGMFDVCYETRGPFRCKESAFFVDQIVIEDGSFSAGGDSGSGIVTDDGNYNPVGLLFAGSSLFTLANPIEAVLFRFGVTIDDGSGGNDPGNNPPTAGDVNTSVDEDPPLPIDWLPDVDDLNMEDVLECSIATQPAKGLASVNSDCTGGTYAPNLDFNGPDPFTYAVSDGSASDQGTVTVVVNPINDAPVASDNGYSATVGTTLNMSAPGVLENDSDVDGDELTPNLVAGPSNAIEFGLNDDGSFFYKSDGTGNDSFTYEASDGTLSSDVVTVTITVSEAADAMHVGNLTPSAINQGSTWDAVVTITIVDTNGVPVSDTAVRGTWSGPGSGNGDCSTTTDENGQCTVLMTGIPKRTSSVSYVVDMVEGSLAYADTGETSITVFKP